MIGMEIKVVYLMVYGAVAVITVGISAVLLGTVSFGVLQNLIQVMLGVEVCTMIVRK